MPIFTVPIAIAALGSVLSRSTDMVTDNVAAVLTPQSENVAIDPPQINVSHIAIAAVLGVGAFVAIAKLKDL